MVWFANKGQILQIIIQGIALVIAAKKAFPDMDTSNFFSAGAIIFYLLVASVLVSLWFTVRELVAARRKTKALQDERLEKVPILFWSLPLADAVLRATSELRAVEGKTNVRILTTEGGCCIAILLVQMFHLAEWHVQDNPADARQVFLLPSGRTFLGVRVLTPKSLGVITATDVTTQLKAAILSSEIRMIFNQLFPNMVEVEDLPRTATENVLQIEVGEYPR